MSDAELNFLQSDIDIKLHYLFTLVFHAHEILHHLISGRNDLTVGLIGSLGNHHVTELFRQIHVGHLQ